MITENYKYILNIITYLFENCRIPLDYVGIIDEGRKLRVTFKYCDSNVLTLSRELDIYQAMYSKCDYAEIFCRQIEQDFCEATGKTLVESDY